MLLLVVFLVAGCSAKQTPYEVNDGENFTVSVKYDANGGTFTTNTSVIVDSYNLDQLPKNSAGQAQIALLPPDSSFRGGEAFTATRSGYFLAGWYAKRTETLDAQGNAAIVYQDKWNFEEGLLNVDPTKIYTSSEPVLTLYAAWIPLFEIQIYDLNSGEYLESITYDPTVQSEIKVPALDPESGAINMYQFPKRDGYTFQGAFYDPDGKKPAESVIDHPGQVDYVNGCSKDSVLKLYVDWLEGEWFHIYNVEQFLDSASVNGNYVIHSDLDFTDKVWPTSLMYGNFNGTIQGNGHTFKNITFNQSNNSKVNAGLFGHLTEMASITDLTFENVEFCIKSGTRVAGASFGLLSGTVSDECEITGIQIVNSRILIHSDCYFGTEDYVIGLVCGMGETGIDGSDILCEATGPKPDSVSITVNDGSVTLEFLP